MNRIRVLILLLVLDTVPIIPIFVISVTEILCVLWFLAFATSLRCICTLVHLHAQFLQLSLILLLSTLRLLGLLYLLIFLIMLLCIVLAIYKLTLLLTWFPTISIFQNRVRSLFILQVYLHQTCITVLLLLNNRCIGLLNFICIFVLAITFVCNHLFSVAGTSISLLILLVFVSSLVIDCTPTFVLLYILYLVWIQFLLITFKLIIQLI